MSSHLPNENVMLSVNVTVTANVCLSVCVGPVTHPVFVHKKVPPDPEGRRGSDRNGWF